MTSSGKPWAKLIDHEGKPLDRMPDSLRAGTNAILIEDGRILLHRRADTGYWALPGGRMEIGESGEACCVREMAEETGLRCRVSRLIGVYSAPQSHVVLRYPDGFIVHYVILLYEVERTGGDLAVSLESTDIRFFSLDSLPEPMAAAERMCISDALSGAEAAFSR